jgi:hypothetical protein
MTFDWSNYVYDPSVIGNNIKAGQSVLLAGDLQQNCDQWKRFLVSKFQLPLTIELYVPYNGLMRQKNGIIEQYQVDSVDKLRNLLFDELHSVHCYLREVTNKFLIFTDGGGHLGAVFCEKKIVASRQKRWDRAFIKHMHDNVNRYGPDGKAHILRILQDLQTTLPDEHHRFQNILEQVGLTPS